MNQPLPQQIGKYPVVRHLGSGATSEIYLCHDAVADESLHYIVMEHVERLTMANIRLSGV